MTSIRKKALLFMLGALVVLGAGMLLLSRSVMLGGFLDLETQDMKQQLSRVEKGVASYLDVLDTTAFDWSAWDDAYDFVVSKDPSFVEANLVDEIFQDTGLRLDFVIFFDKAQNVVFEKGYDRAKNVTVPVPQGIFGHLSSTGLAPDKISKGFLVLPEGLFVIVSRPIITSKETGPNRGQLLMGRKFDSGEIKRLSGQMELDLALHSPNAPPPDYTNAHASGAGDSLGWVMPLDSERIAGGVVLDDIYEKPAAFIQVTKARKIYQRGLSAVGSVLGSVAATGILLSVILIFVLERLVLSPLKQMQADIQKIEGLKDLSVRLEVREMDELGQLARVMNEMLEKLDAHESELIRLERLSALGEMAAGINHNLNNILVGVTVSSEFLLESTEDPKMIEYVRTINRAGKQAADLVARLQDAVLGDSDEGVLHSLNTVLRDSVETARTRWKDEAELKGIEIRVLMDLADDLPQIRGSSSGLYNIMLNLIFNAVDAMPEGGDLEIQSRQVGGGVQVSVRDTGVGMDAETKKRVFEPFFTTKVEIGTGLGLATVYNTVVRWGGRVDVDSVEGAGSVLTVWLPSEGLVQEETEELDVIDSPSGQILVVDDHDVIIQLVEHVLRPLHVVSCLSDSAEVMPALEDADYDVVVLDLGMPGIPGDKVAESIRLRFPHICLVLMTGWRIEDNDPRLNLFDFVLKKPLHDMKIVRDVVAQAVNLSGERRKELR